MLLDSGSTISVAATSNLPGVQLNGNTAVPTASGAATFSGLWVQGRKGALWVNLTFSSPGLVSTTVQFNFVPGTATELKISPNYTAAIIQIQGLPYISVPQTMTVFLNDACGNAPVTPSENVYVCSSLLHFAASLFLTPTH